MPYFVMTCEGEFPSATLESCPDLPDGGWLDGQPVKIVVPTPMIYTMDPERPGNPKAMYEGVAYPLMRDDLIEAIQSAGADNLELFEATIEDASSQRKYTNYKSVNIIGIVSAADMEKSVLMGISDSTMIDADFDSLAIDEKRASPFKIFRLAENVSAIIVDDSVKQMIVQHAIPGMVFYDPADWSG